jgi:hypothetical protein
MHTTITLHNRIIKELYFWRTYHDRPNGEACEANCCYKTDLQKDNHKCCYSIFQIALYRKSTVWSVPGIKNSKKTVTPLVPMWQQ